MDSLMWWVEVALMALPAVEGLIAVAGAGSLFLVLQERLKLRDDQIADLTRRLVAYIKNPGKGHTVQNLRQSVKAQQLLRVMNFRPDP